MLGDRNRRKTSVLLNSPLDTVKLLHYVIITCTFICTLALSHTYPDSVYLLLAANGKHKGSDLVFFFSILTELALYRLNNSTVYSNMASNTPFPKFKSTGDDMYKHNLETNIEDLTDYCIMQNWFDPSKKKLTHRNGPSVIKLWHVSGFLISGSKNGQSPPRRREYAIKEHSVNMKTSLTSF